MKLLFCPLCYDVIRLVEREWRKCDCELSGGQYNKDGMTATLGGYARVLGISNTFFNELWMELDNEQRASYRERNHYGPGDCWWGEFKGDTQIFRVASAEGPRLRIKVTALDGRTNELKVIDIRAYTVDGQVLPIVTAPANPLPSFKGNKVPRWVRFINKAKMKRRKGNEEEQRKRKADEKKRTVRTSG